MKFCERYEEYANGREEEMPVLNLRKLEKILRTCKSLTPLQHAHQQEVCVSSDKCQVCDTIFFPSLLKEMREIVGFFNQRAKVVLKLHLASGIGRYFRWAKSKIKYTRRSLVQEGEDLIMYAILNYIALRKILKKYDKVHDTKQGQAFGIQVGKMHFDIVQSPWLRELIALSINTREGKGSSGVMNTVGPLEDSIFSFDCDKPMLSCRFFGSFEFNTDLTCSICLDTVFDPVSLKCGHIFCYVCACSSASVTIVDGLKAAHAKEKCPLCRRAGVYQHAVHLHELSMLLRRNCGDYWEKRVRVERLERVRQAKQHWQWQCQAFVGV